MIKVIPLEWGLSLEEFSDWADRTQAEVHQRINISHPIYTRPEEFYFTREEDLIAFKLTFKKVEIRSTNYNVAVGWQALTANTTGSNNPFIGHQAMATNYSISHPSHC